jgi:ligand-binding sensor domain-containing protein/signal transduction histidine kinase
VWPGPAALAADKQLAQFAVEHWRVKDGLPGDSVVALAQATDGQLWIATLGGLAYYDGIRVTRAAGPGDSRLAPLDVRRLLAGADGSVWAGSPYFAPLRFRAGEPAVPAPGWPAGHSTAAWAQDARGEIWVATGGGLVRISNGRVLEGPRRWQFDDRADQGGAGAGDTPAAGRLPRATELRFDRAGTAWLGTDRGLFTLAGGRLRRHPGVPADHAVTAMHEDRRGTIWVAAAGQLHGLDGDRTRRFGRAEGLPSGSIVSLADDEDGSLWLGTADGLGRLRDGRIQLYAAGDGLPEKDVTAVLVDREGSLWVGTRNGGLSQFSSRTLDTAGVPDEVRHSEVASLIEDAEGAMWFALRDRGVVRVQDGRARKYTRADGLPSDQVWTLMPGQGELSGQPGDVWIGTGAGLRRWRAGAIHDPGIWPEPAMSLYRDRHGALWIGGNGALGRLAPDGTLKRFGAADGLPPRQVRSLAEDAQGTLWIGGMGIPPIVHLDSSGQRFVRPGGLHKRRLSPVRSMWTDRSGAFWLSADRSGLVRLRGTDVKQFDARRAFDAEMLYQMLEDDAGDFWIGTNKGLVRIARASLDAAADGQRPGPEVISFDTTDRRTGVVASAIRQPGAWKARDGRLWFATTRGAVSIDPRGVRTNLVRPPVVIEAVLVDGRPLPTSGESELGPRPRRLEVHYAARTLLEPRKVRYRHRVEGIDRDWVDAGAGRTAVYTELPPGAYRFQVQASNSDGIWNEAGGSLGFRVPTPIHGRPWFYALIALALVPIGLGVYRLRVARLRAQYAGMFAERNRVARELHDTILQGMTGIGLQLHAIRDHLKRAPEQSQLELEELQQTVVRCLEETRRVVWDLRGREERPGDLGPALMRFARRLFKDSPAVCEVEVEGTPRHLPHVVENELFRIAQEGLRNASAHAGASRVDVRLAYRPAEVALTIQDDGRGFAAEEAGDGARARGHFGLAGLQERAQQIGARVDVRSTPGKGTTVEVVVDQPEVSAHV